MHTHTRTHTHTHHSYRNITCHWKQFERRKIDTKKKKNMCNPKNNGVQLKRCKI